jgi:thiol-disulfide isomerase/thioredoxin
MKPIKTCSFATYPNLVFFIEFLMNWFLKLSFAICLMGFVGQSCRNGSSNTKISGTWRIVLSLQGQQLPFMLSIEEKAPQKYIGYLINADEKILLENITLKDDSLLIPLHIFDAALLAKVKNNRLEGKWVRYGLNKPYEVAFTGEKSASARFSAAVEADSKATAQVSGKWSVNFQSKDGKDTYPAVGVFKQTGNKVTGTFLTTTGDYRYLEGVVQGKEILLSAFDGSHAFLFKAKAKHDDSLEGEFWSGKNGYETWTAQRNQQAALPNADSLTFLKKGFDKLAFSFPDLKKQLVSLTDERYKGKVVVVQIMGSWCPNCMDETAFLAPWYAKNKARGVEVIGLAYEQSPEFEKAAPRVQKVVDRFQIEYACLIAGTRDKEEASKTLPMLNKVLAFPTTIFIDKKGQVRRIHTGFNGPGTGIYYDQFVEEFNTFINALLKEN